MRTDWLCQGLIPDAIHSATFKIVNFGEKDTFEISFNTLQCAETDNALFNVSKIYNHWTIEKVTGNSNFGVSKCGLSAQAQLNLSGFPGQYLSSHAAGTTYDLDQKLAFFPTVTDIAVPANASFDGDTAIMRVKLKTMVISDYDYQLFGCTAPLGNCTLNGWLQATVTCDELLRMQEPWRTAKLVYYRAAQNDTVTLLPDFYYAENDTNLCYGNTYHFYFNMNANNFKAMLDSGNFEYTLRGCCTGNDIPKSKYRASFLVMPNPNNCFVLTPGVNHVTPPTITDPLQRWLPLSYKGDEIAVHCPGCVAPGVINSRYKMERMSYGFRDTNDDSRADAGMTKIIKGDSYYKQFENYLNKNFSSYSDTLEDYLSAHFQDGDASGGIGYTYDQLRQSGGILRYLQLSRKIPAGLDTMKLVVDSVVLYIDTIIAGANACIDCGNYGVNANDLVTQRIVRFDGAQAYQHCLDTSAALNEFLFSFTDTTGGNIQTFGSNTNNNYPFLRFEAGQRYRLKVRYHVCGNFQVTTGFILDDVICQSNIENNMWMSGRKQATAQIPEMASNVSDLNGLGFTVSNQTGYDPADSVYVNHYLFRCETLGGRHYFFPHSGFNISKIINSSGCNKKMSVIAYSDIANYRNKGQVASVDVYPFEYRPVSLLPDTITLQMPTGYVLASASIKTDFAYTQNNNFTPHTTGPFAVNVTTNTGTVVFTRNDLPAFSCVDDNVVPAQGDVNTYLGDQYTQQTIDCILEPIACNTNPVTPLLRDIQISFGGYASVCQPQAGCGFEEVDTLPIPSTQNIQTLVVNPNLDVTLTSTTIQAQQAQLCWEMDITNYTASGSTAADFVFIGVPNTANDLTNWVFTPTNGTPIQAVNGIIALANTLNSGGVITGELCADFEECGTDADFYFYYGWNCSGFPVQSQLPDQVCGVDSVQIGYNLTPTLLTNEGKTYTPATYALCDNITITACHKSSNNGFVYLNQVELLGLVPGLTVISATLVHGGLAVQLTGGPALWPVTTVQMQSLGFTDGGMPISEIVCTVFELNAGCEFAGGDVLPDVLVTGLSYCGDTVTSLAAFNNTTNFSMGSSQCADCWSVTKTTVEDTVTVNQNFTFNITVCNNSINTQTATLTDVAPNFVRTGGTLPTNVTLLSLQCSTFTVIGNFTTPGSCNSHYNVATVTSPANTVWMDSVCVTVVEPPLRPCVTDTTIFWSNDTMSSTLLAGYVNKAIIITDTLVVNDSLCLQQCKVMTYAGAKIVVTATGKLVLNITVIEGCDSMWRGVYMNVSGKMWLKEQSRISDADVAIYANDKCELHVLKSALTNSVTGIYVPQKSSGNSTFIEIDGATFGLFAAAFKPNYVNQPAHFALPKAGMDVRDVTINITSVYTNYFYNMTAGIVATRSDVVVSNCTFRKMDPSYNYGLNAASMSPS